MRSYEISMKFEKKIKKVICVILQANIFAKSTLYLDSHRALSNSYDRVFLRKQLTVAKASSSVLINILNKYLFVRMNLLKCILTGLGCNDQTIYRARKRSRNQQSRKPSKQKEKNSLKQVFLKDFHRVLHCEKYRNFT